LYRPLCVRALIGRLVLQHQGAALSIDWRQKWSPNGHNRGRQTAMMIELRSSSRWLALKIQHPEIIR